MYNRRKHPRRKHPRTEVDWPVSVMSTLSTSQGRVKNIRRGGPLTGTVKNISPGGVLLNLPEELQLNEHIQVVIEIPERGSAITAEGYVVRAFPVVPGNVRYSGVRFVNNSNKRLELESGTFTDLYDSIHTHPNKGLDTFYSLTKKIFYFSICILSIYFFYQITHLKNTETQNTSEIKNLKHNIQKLGIAIDNTKNDNASLDTIQKNMDEFQKKLDLLGNYSQNNVTFENVDNQIEKNESEGSKTASADTEEQGIIQVAPLVQQ